VCCAASSNRKETGGLIMFGTEPWGYGGYGQFHMVIWIMLALPSWPGSSGTYDQVLRDAR
jgi:hypothetical protein